MDETRSKSDTVRREDLKQNNSAEELQESRHHSTIVRKDAPPSENHLSLSRVARQFPSFPFFDLEKRREKSESNDPLPVRDIFLSRDNSPQHPTQEQRRYQGDVILPESQRFFPSFNPHPPQREPNNNQAFLQSGPYPGARGGGPSPFASRRPSFRSYGGHEAVHSPKFAFASNKFKEYGPVDNSILGSGNFEVLKGGTFYDNDDPHLNHNPYDPYLDNSYVVFPSGNPHSHNHVDDFFSNFRDFSEFANRRSGSVQHIGREEGYLEPGFASEHITQISALGIEDMMTSESRASLDEMLRAVVVQPKNNKTQGHEIIPLKILIFRTQKKQTKPKEKQSKPQKSKMLNFKSRKVPKSEKTLGNKKPQNIQEVLEEIDPFPTFTPSKKNTLDKEEDPLIATF